MNWNIEGAAVRGLYLDIFAFRGKVTESRIGYGGGVKHTVKLDEPIEVFGAVREIIIIGSKDTWEIA